jgi:hypothetical protein
MGHWRSLGRLVEYAQETRSVGGMHDLRPAYVHTEASVGSSR